jgi:hypothetical protein
MYNEEKNGQQIYDIGNMYNTKLAIHALGGIKVHLLQQ